MSQSMNQSDPIRLQKLRQEWALLALISGLFILAGFLVLSRFWIPASAWGWLVVTTALVGYQFADLWAHLADNRLKGEDPSPLFPGLGPANQVTIARAVMLSALAGFLCGPWPQGWLAWAPGGLYLSAAVLDFLDGYLARVTGQTTVLGEMLDMKWDGVGVFIGAALSVLYGQTPVPYVLVGLARHLFLLGLWVRARQSRPVYDLPPSRFRRALAGAQMGFIGVVLLPVYGPPVTQIAAVLFMLPFLIGFTSDYLAVTGRIGQETRLGWAVHFRRLAGAYLPLFIRALLVILLVSLLIVLFEKEPLDWGMAAIAAVAIPALLFGAAGRLVALSALLLSAFGLQSAPLEWRYWSILFCSTVLFTIGTGPLSLWKPEDWLIDHRAGEPAGKTQS
jgi:CDP-diacylglycerol---glycerol-3-phosphate 3-phosphatidyltransferase